MVATVIYALPPVMRLATLGIRQVPPGSVEVAQSFGSTGLQTLAKVKLPMSIPSIKSVTVDDWEYCRDPKENTNFSTRPLAGTLVPSPNSKVVFSATGCRPNRSICQESM